MATDCYALDSTSDLLYDLAGWLPTSINDTLDVALYNTSPQGICGGDYPGLGNALDLVWSGKTGDKIYASDGFTTTFSDSANPYGANPMGVSWDDNNDVSHIDENDKIFLSDGINTTQTDSISTPPVSVTENEGLEQYKEDGSTYGTLAGDDLGTTGRYWDLDGWLTDTVNDSETLGAQGCSGVSWYDDGSVGGETCVTDNGSDRHYLYDGRMTTTINHSVDCLSSKCTDLSHADPDTRLISGLADASPELGVLRLKGYEPAVAKTVNIAPARGLLSLKGYEITLSEVVPVELDIGVLNLVGNELSARHHLSGIVDDLFESATLTAAWGWQPDPTGIGADPSWTVSATALEIDITAGTVYTVQAAPAMMQRVHNQDFDIYIEQSAAPDDTLYHGLLFENTAGQREHWAVYFKGQRSIRQTGTLLGFLSASYGLAFADLHQLRAKYNAAAGSIQGFASKNGTSMSWTLIHQQASGIGPILRVGVHLARAATTDRTYDARFRSFHSLLHDVSPETGVLSFLGKEAQVEGGLLEALPEKGLLTLKGYEPNVGVHKDVAPEKGLLNLKGYAPSETTEYKISPERGLVQLLGGAVAANTGATVVPELGKQIFKGNAVEHSLTKLLLPEAGKIVFKGNEPAVALSSRVEVERGLFDFIGHEIAEVKIGRVPNTGTFWFKGYEPDVTVSKRLQVERGLLSFVGKEARDLKARQIDLSLGKLNLLGKEVSHFSRAWEVMAAQTTSWSAVTSATTGWADISDVSTTWTDIR